MVGDCWWRILDSYGSAAKQAAVEPELWRLRNSRCRLALVSILKTLGLNGHFCFPHLIWFFFLLQKYSCSIKSNFLALLTDVFYCSCLKKQPFNILHVCSFQESPPTWHKADVSDIPELCPEMGWERSECFMEWPKLSKDPSPRFWSFPHFPSFMILFFKSSFRVQRKTPKWEEEFFPIQTFFPSEIGNHFLYLLLMQRLCCVSHALPAHSFQDSSSLHRGWLPAWALQCSSSHDFPCEYPGTTVSRYGNRRIYYITHIVNWDTLYRRRSWNNM